MPAWFSFITMDQQEIDLFKIFAEDKRMILYRPEWRKITGSVTAAILLQQIIYHWDRNGRKPFYKFKEPPDSKNKFYRDGDSWTEELGFSRKEFDAAIKKIGYKKSKKNQAKHGLPVEYWIDVSRLTHYTIHPKNLQKLLSKLYEKKHEEAQEEQQEEEQQEQSQKLSEGQQEVSQNESQEQENNDRKSPNCSDCPVKSNRDFTKSTNGDLGKDQIGLYETTKRGDRKSTNGAIDLTTERGFTKSTNGDLDLTKTTTKNKITTETATEKNGDEVGDVINSIFSQKGRKEKITPAQIKLICSTHNLKSEHEILKAVRFLAARNFIFAGSNIGSVIALLIGPKNENGGHDSSCFYDGESLFPEPEPEPESKPEPQKCPDPPIPQTQIDWQAAYNVLPKEDKAAIRAQAEKKLASHKDKMKPKMYEETLKLAIFREIQGRCECKKDSELSSQQCNNAPMWQYDS